MRIQILIMVFFGTLIISPSQLFSATQPFINYCLNSYETDKVCPEQDCQLKCLDGSQTPDCVLGCQPKECRTFSVQSCPKRFCTIMTDCATEESCQPKTPFEQIPDCGTLGYNAQEVECCLGLIKRCGFDYLDGKCNMVGKGTAYQFPICIPCGDGVCTNFENHCNCPEDCKKDIIPLD